MDVGEPTRTIIVEPIEDPVPRETPPREPDPDPVEVPPEPATVPA